MNRKEASQQPPHIISLRDFADFCFLFCRGTLSSCSGSRASLLKSFWQPRCSLSLFFPRDFVETSPRKPSDGRDYREFLHKGAQDFCIAFPSISVTFWSPGVLLVTLGASLGPGPHFLINFETILDPPGLLQGTLGPPCGPHGAPLCRLGRHF